MGLKGCGVRARGGAGALRRAHARARRCLGAPRHAEQAAPVPVPPPQPSGRPRAAATRRDGGRAAGARAGAPCACGHGRRRALALHARRRCHAARRRRTSGAARSSCRAGSPRRRTMWSTCGATGCCRRWSRGAEGWTARRQRAARRPAASPLWTPSNTPNLRSTWARAARPWGLQAGGGGAPGRAGHWQGGQAPRVARRGSGRAPLRRAPVLHACARAGGRVVFLK
jgi:hypothetical protein